MGQILLITSHPPLFFSNEETGLGDGLSKLPKTTELIGKRTGPWPHYRVTTKPKVSFFTVAPCLGNCMVETCGVRSLDKFKLNSNHTYGSGPQPLMQAQPPLNVTHKALLTHGGVKTLWMEELRPSEWRSWIQFTTTCDGETWDAKVVIFFMWRWW